MAWLRIRNKVLVRVFASEVFDFIPQLPLCAGCVFKHGLPPFLPPFLIPLSLSPPHSLTSSPFLSFVTLNVAPQLRHGVVLSFPLIAFASAPQLGHSAVTMKKVLKAWNDSSSISGMVKDRNRRELKKPKMIEPRGEKNTTPRRPNDTREDARASLLLFPGGPPPGKFGPLYILSEVDEYPLRNPKRSLRDRLIPTSLKPKVFEIGTPFIDMSVH